LFAMDFGGDTLEEICQQFTEGQDYLVHTRKQNEGGE
jgi:hypothetical protein